MISILVFWILFWIEEPPERLSELGFFKGEIKKLTPTDSVFAYELNVPLFSDYAEKQRFIALPKGKQMVYTKNGVLDFPEGTTLIKNFYYLTDRSLPDLGKKIIETRLLRKIAGIWQADTYVWNDQQTEAYLELAGDTKMVEFEQENHTKRSFEYSIPNQNQCKGCHNTNEVQMPIGPTARQLNKSINGVNQLENWQKLGILNGLPALDQVEKFPEWADPHSGSINERARAWLHINCAHCHSTAGPAKTSGLFLTYDEADLSRVGLFKTPVAAGRASGKLKYSIVPGKSEASILYARVASADPGIMMPELGRKLVYSEGLETLKKWIKNMPEKGY